jgi:hypothetical protein
LSRFLNYFSSFFVTFVHRFSFLSKLHTKCDEPAQEFAEPAHVFPSLPDSAHSADYFSSSVIFLRFSIKIFVQRKVENSEIYFQRLFSDFFKIFS